MHTYVYALINKQTNIPFYIGMGQGPRAASHLKDYRHRKGRLYTYIKKCKKEGVELGYEILHENLTRMEAVEKEQELIAKFGRKKIDKDGILLNLHPGGMHNEGSRLAKVIRQYDTRGNLIRKHQSICAAGRFVGAVDHSGISVCCKHYDKVKFCGGFIWTYDDDDKANHRLSLIKVYACFCAVTGKLLGTYDTSVIAERETGVCHANITRSCNTGSVTGDIKPIHVWKHLLLSEVPEDIEVVVSKKNFGAVKVFQDGELIAEHLSIGQAADHWFERLGKTRNTVSTHLSLIRNGKRPPEAWGLSWVF